MDRINRELVAKAEAIDPPRRVVPDMDSTEIPVYGRQEHSAYNGHFESTCYHPLLYSMARPTAQVPSRVAARPESAASVTGCGQGPRKKAER